MVFIEAEVWATLVAGIGTFAVCALSGRLFPTRPHRGGEPVGGPWLLAAYTAHIVTAILAPRVAAVSHVCDVTLDWVDGPGEARTLTLMPVTHEAVLLDQDGRVVDHFALPTPDLVLVPVAPDQARRAAYYLSRGDVGTLTVCLKKEPSLTSLHLAVESAEVAFAEWMVAVSDPTWTPT